MKSLFVNSNNFTIYKFFDTFYKSLGELLLFFAASSTFCPCSSVPVTNKTSNLCSFLYLAIGSNRLGMHGLNVAYH